MPLPTASVSNTKPAPINLNSTDSRVSNGGIPGMPAALAPWCNFFSNADIKSACKAAMNSRQYASKDNTRCARKPKASEWGIARASGSTKGNNTPTAATPATQP